MKIVGIISAAEDMEAQRDVCQGYAYNLDHMWRAVGSPNGMDPLYWSREDLAGPFIEGVAAYFRNLDRAKGVPRDAIAKGLLEEVFFPLTADESPAEGWRLGDMLGTATVATAYARYLDGDDANG
jgi:hypothetical protein